jgi:hypothetical protein
MKRSSAASACAYGSLVIVEIASSVATFSAVSVVMSSGKGQVGCHNPSATTGDANA